MAKSDYSYTILKNVIAIKDLNKGRMSVTNNIEEVLSEIQRKETLILADYFVIYSDSFGDWDGFNPVTNNFYSLSSTMRIIEHFVNPENT